jgi:hypothetical protein
MSSVPTFEQSHRPRFAVLHDRRCEDFFACGFTHGSPLKIASIRGLFSRQIIWCVFFNAMFRTVQNPDSSHLHSLTREVLFNGCG